MSRWSRYPWTAAALVVLAAAIALLADAGPAGTSMSVKVSVSPDRGLFNGEVVTVSGHGLVHSYNGAAQTWFVTECTTAVHGRMSPATDTAHCDITDAKAIRVAHDGWFSTRFRVRSGIIGDGYCGTAGHPACVIGVGTAQGLGTVVKVTFGGPSAGQATTRG